QEQPHFWPDRLLHRFGLFICSGDVHDAALDVLGAGSLHWPLYINALATFLTDERFDDGEATKHVGRSAVRTPGATNVVGVKFNQSYASAVGGNRSTTAPQELQTRSATPPFATPMRQPSQWDPYLLRAGRSGSRVRLGSYRIRLPVPVPICPIDARATIAVMRWSLKLGLPIPTIS